MQYNAVYITSIIILGVQCTLKHSGVYMQCTRGQCRPVPDKEVDWEFDQPQQFYMEREGGTVREQLEEERLDIE